jgi:hypothetical protein
VKNTVEKRAGKIIVRPRANDATAKVRGLASKLTENGSAVLTQRERDLLLVALAQRLGIEV